MSRKDNKWDVNEVPPPPMFVGKKERDFVKQLNDELLERVIGQAILYYAVSLEHTKFHSLYGEAIEKTTYPPIRVYALVEPTDTETNNTGFGLDKIRTITVHFHKRRLTEEQDTFVREGDYIQWDGEFYEIRFLTQPRYTFGQSGQRFEINATCKRVRSSAFNAQ